MPRIGWFGACRIGNVPDVVSSCYIAGDELDADDWHAAAAVLVATVGWLVLAGPPRPAAGPRRSRRTSGSPPGRRASCSDQRAPVAVQHRHRQSRTTIVVDPHPDLPDHERLRRLDHRLVGDRAVPARRRRRARADHAVPVRPGDRGRPELPAPADRRLATSSPTARTTPTTTCRPGRPTTPQRHFSIAHDQAQILPLLRQAEALNPHLQIMASPWSPPAWMKTSGSLIGGRLIDDPRIYRSYALYLLKFVQAYRGERRAGRLRSRCRTSRRTAPRPATRAPTCRRRRRRR